VFTDRFIKLPIKEYNTEVKELTGKEGELIENWEKINPFDIQSYRPDIDSEESFYLAMRGRDTFAVYMRIEEFEKLLNKHLKDQNP
jgi:hypothetical protein